MFDDFLPIPDAESLPFCPLVLKLVVCIYTRPVYIYPAIDIDIYRYRYIDIQISPGSGAEYMPRAIILRSSSRTKTAVVLYR